jgi:hypothetical protein
MGNNNPPPVMAVTDFTKLPNEILVELINFDNGTSLTPDSVTFGTPVVSGGVRNTQLVVTAKTGSFYTGSVTIQYNRVDLSTVPGVRSKSFVANGLTKISDLIPQINNAYQLNLQPEDFIDGPLPTFSGTTPNETLDFDLIAGPNSLIYNNKVTLQVVCGLLDLSVAIKNLVLNGLVYTQP